MKVIEGDLWNCSGWKIIPTNCSYNQQLMHATTGRGVALQAARKFPGLKPALGRKLRDTNRAPQIHVFSEWQLICLPTKRWWSDASSLSMIRAGLRRVAELADDLPSPIYLPLLGCGYGELNEEKVLPVLHEHLDDRFILVKRDETVKSRYPQSFTPSIRNDRS